MVRPAPRIDPWEIRIYDGIPIKALADKSGLAITSLTTMLEHMEKGNLICRKQDESDKHGRSKEMMIANIGQVPYNISYPYRDEHFEEDLEKAFQLGVRVAKTALGE